MAQATHEAGANATIIDVAREAGVSYATVSRVVNNKAHVKPGTRERVLVAMQRLGYVANLQARSLAGGRTQVVGLLVQDLGTAYIGEIIRGIDGELAAAGYDLVLYTTHRQTARESTHVTTLTRGLADGLLLVLPRNPEAYLETLRAHAFPYVLIDHDGTDSAAPAVGATNWQGAYDATCYLIALGHKRIGFIAGTRGLQAAEDRRAGYLAALAAHDLPADLALIVEGNFLQPESYNATGALLHLPAPPTAIFAANDVSAFGVMEAVRDQGLRIPQDVSIVGFDDIPQASNVHPPLTTVRQPLEEMGRAATRMLLDQLADPQHPPGRVDLPTELIIRHSCMKRET